MLYAVIKKYAISEGTEEKHFEVDWEYKPNDHYAIYDKMMELTGNDHEISDDAACWCELASIGEIYEFSEGEIEIMDID